MRLRKSLSCKCPGWDSNPHGNFFPRDFKSDPTPEPRAQTYTRRKTPTPLTSSSIVTWPARHQRAGLFLCAPRTLLCRGVRSQSGHTL